MSTVSLANAETHPLYLPAGTIVLQFSFKTDQIVAIQKSMYKMKIKARCNTEIANTNVINNLTRTLSNIAVKSFVTDIRSFPIRAVKAKQKITVDKKKRKEGEKKLKEEKREVEKEDGQEKKEEEKRTPTANLELETPEDLAALPKRTLDECIQNAKFISSLLNQNFICNSPEIKELQLSDLLLAKLYQKTINMEIKSFTIKNHILYKLSKQNTFLLCLPSNLCKLIIQTVHVRLGFHFSWRHTVNLLKPLIFHPHLESLIKTQIKSCLI